MRDSAALETGDQTVASGPAVDAAVSRAAEVPEGRTASDDAVFGSPGRGKRWLWAVLSFLFALAIAVSTVMMRSERDRALDEVVKGARDDAQLAAATLKGKHLTKPVKGSSYDKLANKLWKSVSTDGTVAGVIIWSSQGRILFSLDESSVGESPPEMRSLITGIADGSGSSRVVDDTVQTFTPVSKRQDGPVAIVEIDQPLSVVEAQTGDLWRTLRLASGVGLVVSLLMLILSFVRAGRPARAREPEESPAVEERGDGDEGAEMNAEGQQEEPSSETSAPTYEELFGLPHDFDDMEEPSGDLEGEPEAVQGEGDPEPIQDEGDSEALEGDPQALEGDSDAPEGDPDALEGDPEALKSIQQWEETYEDIVHEELDAQEQMRQRREEFKVRAEAAALRVKKLEAEPHEAQPTPDSIARDDGRQD